MPPLTVTEALAALFDGTLSVSDALTCAESKTVPALTGRTVNVILALPPPANPPRSHSTEAPVTHDPVEGVTETKSPEDGSAAIRLTPEAADGPLFVTVAVKVVFAPVDAEGGGAIEIAISAFTEERSRTRLDRRLTKPPVPRYARPLLPQRVRRELVEPAY